MRVHVADHPLVAHKLTTLRDERTDSPTFRRLAEELVTLLAYEATRDVRTIPVEVQTPVAPAVGVRLAQPRPLVVPILRAGLGMLDGMVRLLPTAEVGFLGMVRDESTLVATTYADRLPDDLADRQVYVLDPMLATGGTLAAAIELLLARGAARRHRDLPARRAGGARAPAHDVRGQRRHGHRGHRRPRREAERPRLHRPRPRRRRRPPLRHRLTHVPRDLERCTATRRAPTCTGSRSAGPAAA